MSLYYGWPPYVSVAARRAKAEKAAAKAKKSGIDYSPIEASRGAIAKTFWGKAWCDNLEAYGDYANRLPRGRSYARNGSVIDLKITEGAIRAQVMGSSLYQVAIEVRAVPPKQWQSIGADCAGSIDSLIELLQGRLSTAVMKRICAPRTGLFPAPGEIGFSCSCPDPASMCKHVAAVLYGVGARLDRQPGLLFGLRRVDAKELVRQAGAGLPKSSKGPAAGIDMDPGGTPTRKVAPRKAQAQVQVQVPATVAAGKKPVKPKPKTATRAQTGKAPAEVLNSAAPARKKSAKKTTVKTIRAPARLNK